MFKLAVFAKQLKKARKKDRKEKKNSDAISSQPAPLNNQLLPEKNLVISKK